MEYRTVFLRVLKVFFLSFGVTAFFSLVALFSTDYWAPREWGLGVFHYIFVGTLVLWFTSFVVFSLVELGLGKRI